MANFFKYLDLSKLFGYRRTDSGVAYTKRDGAEFLAADVMKISLSATEAVAASTTGVHAAVTDTGEDQVISTGITNPPYPRNITATAGGTAGDIKAIQVTVHGTNMADEVISETLSAFTVNTAGTVTGAKIFKTVTYFELPAHDGTGATTAIGFGSKLGIPAKLAHNSHLFTFFGNTVEGTPPTVTVSASAMESNGFTLNSTLDGSVVDAYFVK